MREYEGYALAIADAVDADDQDAVEAACEQALTDMFFDGEDIEVLAYEWECTPEVDPELARKIARRCMRA